MKKYKTIHENAVLINPPKEGKVLTVKEVMEGRSSKYEFIDFENTAEYIDRHLVQVLVEVTKEKLYTEEDIINASKYGYNFHKTTQFPQQEFEDSCINNTKQWLTIFKK